MVTLKTINLKDLKPAEYNPRVIEEDEFRNLSNSINEYGLVDPILVNLKNMTIIGGHQRYDVLLDKYNKNELDGELVLYPRGDIGWVFTDEDLVLEDETHEKGLNIALNRISGSWDYPKLNSLLDELLDVEDFDIHLTGFNNLDTRDLDVDLDDLDIGEGVGISESNGSGRATNTLKMTITFEDKETQEELYNRLTEEGYNCKI